MHIDFHSASGARAEKLYSFSQKHIGSRMPSFGAKRTSVLRQNRVKSRFSSSLKNLETEVFLSLADRCSGGVFDSLRLFL
jgi:hypothetical protein